MNAWEDTVLTGLYNIAPMHLGAGHASGAVDLPIARDAATGFPVLPSSSLKGVAREALTQQSGRNGVSTAQIGNLFGKSIEEALPGGAGAADQAENDQVENGKSSAKTPDSSAGQLCFSEAKLLAYPARSLNRPFLHITCPLILERFLREMRAYGIAEPSFAFTAPPQEKSDKAPSSWAIVNDTALDGQTLVIEDLVIEGNRVVTNDEMPTIANALATLFPDQEEHTLSRFKNGLVIISDDDFNELMERIVPVRARIKLTGGKTTDTWRDPETGREEKGNLWYEEYLPSDCLFYSFVGARRHWKAPDSDNNGDATPMKTFGQAAAALEFIQIGGDETVGHGICYWKLLTDAASSVTAEANA